MALLEVMLIALHALVVIAAAGHALLNKRDPKAALGWIAVCIIFPFAGPFLYYLFGINRVRTRARKLDRQSPFRPVLPSPHEEEPIASILHTQQLPPEYKELASVSHAITRHPLLGGNRIETLHNGEQAYPSMLKAIEEANKSLYLSTYIFETRGTGQCFIDALARAAARGVEVRVIIDGIGGLNSLPPAARLLKRQGVRVARFLPPRLFPPMIHINLRNHRKILVVDGRIGFVGGMNIGDRHLAEKLDNPSRVVDIHFRIRGPVVAQIEQTFLEDWGFTTGEYIGLSNFQHIPEGNAVCRTIVEGPNEDFDRLATILLGAVSAARRRVAVMTPYFLPSRELSGVLKAAALRGVEVQVVLPSKNNLPYIHWATRNMIWELLSHGVRVYYQPPPFVHCKLFVVDDHYVQIGSANLDPRSLRLNFEIVLEVYERFFGEEIASYVTDCIKASKEVTLEEVDSRPLMGRIRDALAWLFTPYL
ncbi:MAG: cardiolipin synthase [Desulfatiglandales bacterium]